MALIHFHYFIITYDAHYVSLVYHKAAAARYTSAPHIISIAATSVPAAAAPPPPPAPGTPRPAVPAPPPLERRRRRRDPSVTECYAVALLRRRTATA